MEGSVANNNNRTHYLVLVEPIPILQEEVCLAEINKSQLVADFLVRIPKAPQLCHLVSNQINPKALADNKIKLLEVDCLEVLSNKTP